MKKTKFTETNIICIRREQEHGEIFVWLGQIAIGIENAGVRKRAEGLLFGNFLV